ncbi:MAG: GAF domain-containing protein [Chloroflexi bacterium]|nr:MAG: GAF domain-containing protein [Chloroflexota bacterium]
MRDPANGGSSGRRDQQAAFEIIDGLADARLTPAEFLAAVTKALSEVRSGTWVVTLMGKDPSSSLVLSGDSTNPSMAGYVDGMVAEVDRPQRAPTMSLSQQVIETGRRVFWPALPWLEFVSMLTPFEQTYLKDNPPPITPELQSVLVVPMHSRGAIVGSLALFEPNASYPITPKDADWIQEAADRVGMVTENAQLYEDAIMRLDRLSSMQRVSRAISASLDLPFTLKVILEQVIHQLQVDAADVLLIDESDGMLATAASTGFMLTAIPNFRLPLDEGLTGRVLAGRHIETVSSPSEFSQAQRRSFFAREGFKTYGSVPLAAHGKLAGVMEVFHRSILDPDNEWLSFLEAMACVAAIAVNIATLNERLNAAGPSHPSDKIMARVPELSRLEWEVLKLVVQGQTNREISAHIHLSQNTVKFHIRQMLQKTDSTNRTDLTRRAMQHGWLQ